MQIELYTGCLLRDFQIIRISDLKLELDEGAVFIFFSVILL